LLALAKDNEEVLLPGGVRIKVTTRNAAEQTRKAWVAKTLTVFVPSASAIGDV
jgi:hypothetical protein